MARGVKEVSGPRMGLTVTLARGSAAVLEVELPELFRSFVTLTPAPPSEYSSLIVSSMYNCT